MVFLSIGFVYNSIFRRNMKYSVHIFGNFLMSKLLTVQFDSFIKTYGFYSRKMELSIEKGISEGSLQLKRRNFYNYLIIRARPLYKLINWFYTADPEKCKIKINLDHLLFFIHCIIYIGKGLGYRCFSHCKDALKILSGVWRGRVSMKLHTLANMIRRGEGIVVLRTFVDADNYVALNREHAMICACFGHVTNIRHGSPYGSMRSWEDTEVINFGIMTLYSVLKQCIIERPNEIHL